MSRHSRAPKTSFASRPPEAGRVLDDLALIQAAGLRAAVELRGFDEHDLADMLCHVIERVATINAAAALRLRGADAIGVGW